MPNHPIIRRLRLRNFGQLKDAAVDFGDLTVLVGPQATGKSIFLQLLKLTVDAPVIRQEFARFGTLYLPFAARFLDLYLGEGMSGILHPQGKVYVNRRAIPFQLIISGGAAPPRGEPQRERMFFIPAQRVMSLRDGQTRPFMDFKAGDPFCLREFSERINQLVQGEFGLNPQLFPQAKRLNASLRRGIIDNIFGGFKLRSDNSSSLRRIVLDSAQGKKPLPYLVWSAGQREFVPLLLGFYWLMPPTRVSRRDSLEWVVIEEPEMGLHPDAISATFAVVLDLLRRGYRVCLSTHSPHILDLVWAIKVIQKNSGKPSDVLKLFHLPSNNPTKAIAKAALAKDYRVFFFNREGTVRDISSLDPGANSPEESGWGGLTGFSSHVGDVVASVVNRSSHP